MLDFFENYPGKKRARRERSRHETTAQINHSLARVFLENISKSAIDDILQISIFQDTAPEQIFLQNFVRAQARPHGPGLSAGPILGLAWAHSMGPGPLQA